MTFNWWYYENLRWQYDPSRSGNCTEGSGSCMNWVQVIAEYTTRIGCARYDNCSLAPDGFKKVLVVCDYALGASLDRPAYLAGSPQAPSQLPPSNSPGAQSPIGGSPMAQSPIGGSPNNSTVMPGAAAARTPHPFLILVFVASALFLIGGI